MSEFPSAPSGGPRPGPAARAAAPKRQRHEGELARERAAALRATTTGLLARQRATMEQVRVDAEISATARNIDDLVVRRTDAFAGVEVLDPYLLAALGPRALLQLLPDTILANSDADKVDVQLYDHERGGLVIAEQRGFEAEFLAFFRVVGTEGSACAAAAQRAEPVTVSDVEHSTLFTAAGRDVLRDSETRAVQSMPLLAPDRRVLGVVSCHYTGRPRFDHDQQLLGLLADATERAIRWHHDGHRPRSSA
ncbi:GAF domain-containing protein [Nocardia blacklockiae]|uniref:GAF domain-containing protein n=1 Tax=Nocardia blacklockiae TaxID=480036 RepID=UPI0018935D42|nr:GAF domain-containing protein [Nocardia blacklockiae]MBF6169932.1 GAF domain-containing protein [Nocardia blacklockiae]